MAHTHFASGKPTQAPTTNSGVLLDLPPGATHAPLLLVHDEMAWQNTPRGWRPVVRPVQCIPGVMGCAEDSNGILIIQPLVAALDKMGKEVIKPNDRRLDAPFNEWHCAAPSKRGGTHHHCSWEAFGKVGTKSRTQVDNVALDAFTDHLVAKSIVQPMRRDVLEDKLGVISDRILNTTGDKRKTFQAKHDKMLKDWEDQFGEKADKKTKDSK